MRKIKAWGKQYWQTYPHPYLLVGSIAVIVGLIGLLASQQVYQSGDGQRATVEAETLVAGLYDSKEEVFLRPDIAPSHLNRAHVAVTKVTSGRQQGLKKRLEEAEYKYQVLKSLDEIFDSKDFMLVGSKINESAKLKTEITAQKMTEIEKRSPLKQLAKDKFVETVQTLLAEAKQTPDKVSQAQLQVDNLPDRLIAQEGFDSALGQFLNVEKTVLEAGKWGIVDDQMASLETKAKLYAEHILDKVPEDGYSAADLDTFFASPALTAHLTGSQIDNRKLVALTFDDGPFPATTPKVLEILDKYGVKATFFVLGSRAEFDPELLSETVARGHKIGNHTYTHPDLSKETDETVQEQITYAGNAIKQVTGQAPDIYRMPFGAGGQRVVDLLAPMKSIVWNVDSEDWQTQDKDKIIAQVKQTIKPQSIILFHDTIAPTAVALEELIPWLQEQGYHFVYADQVNIGFDHY